MRKFELISVEEVDAGGWAEVVGERTLEYAHFCEFGFAEEVVSMLSFDDGTFEVGVGEALRPYIEVYKGEGAEEALKAFFDKVTELAAFD